MMLDADYDVTLIEPNDRFVHNVGLLRALVDPDFAARIVFPYDHLLSRGRVIRDRAAEVVPGHVTLASGEEIETDFIVLATGSDYPFPAKVDAGPAGDFMDRIAAAREALAQAERPLLIGAGPVGIELAGEITSAWPDKRVTILEAGPRIMPGNFDERLRDQLKAQLAERKVRLVVGETAPLPSPPVGTLGEIMVETDKGTRIEADIWFRCFGGGAKTDYLAGGLEQAIGARGQVSVVPTLLVEGAERVFAIGDVTDIPETKRAGVGRMHAAVVQQNIADILAGRAPSASYTPAPERMVVPLGPDGGAGYDGSNGGRMFARADVVAQKGADLTTDRIAQQFAARDREEAS